MKQIVNCCNHIEKHLHDFTQMAGINRELQDHTNRQNACGMENTYKSKIMVIGNGKKDLYTNKVLLKEINNLKGQLQR